MKARNRVYAHSFFPLMALTSMVLVSCGKPPDWKTASLPERHYRYVLAGALKNRKAYTDARGRYILPGEPPIPESWAEHPPNDFDPAQAAEMRRHLTCMDNRTYLGLLGKHLEDVLLTAKQNDYRVTESEGRMLMTLLSQGADRTLFHAGPDGCFQQLIDAGYSGELVCFFQRTDQLLALGSHGLLRDEGFTPSTPQIVEFYNVYGDVSRKYMDPVSGRKMVVGSDGDPEWQEATEADRKAIARFEDVWKAIQDAHFDEANPTTWSKPELKQPRALFLSLGKSERRECRNCLMVWHRYNLGDMLERWTWDADHSPTDTHSSE